MCETEVQDDLTISNDSRLIRCVPPRHWDYVKDRLASSAFSLRSKQEEKYMSVYLKGTVSLEALTEQYSNRGGEGLPGFVELKVGDIRELGRGFKIRAEPQQGSGLPGHCGIYGNFKKKSNRKELRKISTTLRRPPKEI